jgi:hypothetical protein
MGHRTDTKKAKNARQPDRKARRRYTDGDARFVGQRRALYKAFADTKLGSGTSLRQGRIEDDYGSEAGAPLRSETDDWRDIPLEELRHYHDVWTFLDSKGFVFAAPALLVTLLEDPAARLEQLGLSLELFGYTYERLATTGSCFTAAQRDAIEQAFEALKSVDLGTGRRHASALLRERLAATLPRRCCTRLRRGSARPFARVRS